jgi:hypothetical protein
VGDLTREAEIALRAQRLQGRRSVCTPQVTGYPTPQDPTQIPGLITDLRCVGDDLMHLVTELRRMREALREAQALLMETAP